MIYWTRRMLLLQFVANLVALIKTQTLDLRPVYQ